jgi:lipopolysaccharide/colanic/teichoic acid biosynthesis glycosyltransferase
LPYRTAVQPPPLADTDAAVLTDAPPYGIAPPPPPASKTVPLQPPYSEGSRRIVNVAAALLGVVLAAPLMVCIAVLVKLTSRGPVFYTQTRVGLDRRAFLPISANGRRRTDYGGKPFTIYKFRTMRVNRDPDAQVWAQQDDPRVTVVGRMLRKYRLDELPQLFNVLLGDMNVVGPRPEQPKIFADLRKQIHGYDRRQRVRPGITGWAQINQHYDTSIDSVRSKVHYDLQYVARQSPVEDLRILILTVPVVMFKRGAW